MHITDLIKADQEETTLEGFVSVLGDEVAQVAAEIHHLPDLVAEAQGRKADPFHGGDGER